MRTLSAVLCLGLAATTAPAQGTGTGVSDVGLTVQVGPSTGAFTNLVGQRCGPFSCVPFASTATLTVNSPSRLVRVYGAPNSLYILAMSTGTPFLPCITIAGIDNALILDQPVAAISIGTTGGILPSTSLSCIQGAATYTLNLPPVSPAVIPYYLQAVTFSTSTGAPAFTIAVRDLAR